MDRDRLHRFLSGDVRACGSLTRTLLPHAFEAQGTRKRILEGP